MTDIEKKLTKRALGEERTLSESEELRRFEDSETGTEFGVSPSPAPPAVGAAPPQMGTQVLPSSPLRDDPRTRNPLGASGTLSGVQAPFAGGQTRFQEEDEDEDELGEEAYNPSIPQHGKPLNPPSQRAIARTDEARKREEDSEEEEGEETRRGEAIKALSGIFNVITTKWFARKDLSPKQQSDGAKAEFDHVIQQVYSPSAGTTRFVNTRSPGQPSAKFPIEPGQSGANVRGRQPYNSQPGEPNFGGKPAKPQFPPQAYQNPTNFGSGYDEELGSERYGSRQTGTGVSGQYPQPKPNRNPNIRAGTGHPSSPDMGYAAPKHPSTANTTPSALYNRPTTIISTADEQTQEFSKAAYALGLQKTAIPIRETTRHAPGHNQNFKDISKSMRDSKGNPVESGTGFGNTVDPDTIALRKGINQTIAQDNPRDVPLGGVTDDEAQFLIEKSRADPKLAEIVEKTILIKLGRPLVKSQQPSESGN